jgi:putative phosphoesterase
LEEALSIFERERVDTVLCAGDIAGYGNELDQTVAFLVRGNCLGIAGNHDLWHLERHSSDTVDAIRQTTDLFLEGLPVRLEIAIENKTLYMVHASPPESNLDGIKLLDAEGNLDPNAMHHWTGRLAEFEQDVLIVGHTHQVYAEQLGQTLVVNPGSTLFNHSCATITFPGLECRFYSLSGKNMLKAWNWGMVVD